MMHYRINIIVFFLALLAFNQASVAQELDCKVIINSTQVQSAERSVFDEMEDEFSRFMNDRKWTDDEFSNQEKIQCGLLITLESQDAGTQYTATVQVISVRPTYQTTYETSLLDFFDRDFDFEYQPSQSLNYTDNSFTSNITSLLAYYAYMFLGSDYDSFSELGGARHFEKALQIVNTAQQSGYSGWDQFGSINSRYWISQNTLDRVIEPFREAVYLYHRKGLDIMTEEPEEGRKNILEALTKINQVNKAKPRSIIVINFIDAKVDELTSIFSEGDLAIRREAYDLLKSIDPSRNEDFKKILTN